MPYVLQHTQTLQLFTCHLVNHYQLVYYGVKYWETSEEAEQKFETFLQQQGIDNVKLWHVIEIEEGQMKICNVKLKNNSDHVIYWTAEGKADVRRK